MSTIIVVRKADQIAIAADTLTKYGGGKESAEFVVNHTKLVSVGEAVIAYCGITSAKLMLEDYFSSLKRPPIFNSPESVFAVWIKLHAAFKDRYYLNASPDSDDATESSRFDALIASPFGIYGVGAYRAVQEFSKFYAYGSGREWATGAAWALYESDLTAEAIAERAIAAACVFDDSTGTPIETRQMTISGP
jgi:ATP-dependent HslUV protease, peptidase subunit HslV